jgi:predicted signal transduction protein with EAL and GGDEF domain
MRRLAGLLRRSARDTDFVARYSDDELIVVMPETSQAGARVFSDRLRKCVAGEMAATISCGIAASVAGDDPKSLLARVDSALYTAKAAGTNRLFVHTGAQIREHLSHPAVIARNALSPQARMTRADLPGRSVDGTTCPGASDRSSPADPAGELAGTARA